MGGVVASVASRGRTVLRSWAMCSGVLSLAGPSVAAPAELFISEIVEGSSNNKAVEVYNGTGTVVDLGAAGYQLVFYFNGNTGPGLVIPLTGTLPDGEVVVFAHSSSDAAILGVADYVTGSGLFNGDDAIVLSKAGVVVDSFGQVGTDPGAEWPGGGLDDTLRRKPSVCLGDTQPEDVHLTSDSWDVLPINTFDGLGAHAVICGATADEPPELSTTWPAQAATQVPLDASIVLGFSEAVMLNVDDVLLQCAVSGEHSIVVNGQGTAQLTLQPTLEFAAAEVCTLFVPALAVNDLDAPPDSLGEDLTLLFETRELSVCGGPATSISAIQGIDDTSPLAGQIVTVEAVVVGDFQAPTELQGFFLQSPDAERDVYPTTSEGLFVFASDEVLDVHVGDRVRMTGTVAEYFGLTELTSVSDVQVCGVGETVTPGTLSLPVNSLTDLEAFEGMLVQLPQRLVVTDNYNQGRYGEVLLSAGERLWQPTQVAAPGPAADAVRDANALASIQLDDGSALQNPAWPPHLGPDGTLRVGDSVAGIQAILGYGFGSFELHPTADITFERTNPRPTPPEVGGTLRVASFNVLNYFTTLDMGAAVCGPLQNLDCRGANTPQEFERQRTKVLAALTQLDAHIVGLIELENNQVASLSDLVDGLNAALGPDTYDFVDTGTLGSDAIKVGFIYQPAKVSPWGSHAVLDSTVDPLFDDTRNRPVLAQTFEELSTGERLTVAVHHLKSKGSACVGDPDLGDGQGNCNATRVAAAGASLSWLTSDPTGSDDPDFLMLGDFNAYAQEDPIRLVTESGLRDLLAEFAGPTAYSYVFEGQSGALDQALVTPALASQVTGAAEWHINTDEPRVLDYNTEFNPLGLYQPDVFRSSDHDPLVVGLELSSVAPAPTCGGITATVYVDGTNQIVGGPDHGRPYAGMLRGTAGNDVLVGTAGDDLIRGLGGEDVACGLAGHDAVLGGAANDVVYGGEGNDVLLGLGGADQLHGGAGTDLLEGGAGDDRLSGGDGSDVLSGSAGRDLCDGGPAPDVALSCEHRVSVP